ncbi:TadE family protein [Gimesia algae]|uniref:TadE-like protein n=1 Tax=Gimesia algae TaxID=2527971 RepID=A0A517VBV3_9PLAN|nr:TadE family protein [Gimesia algae]QDT90475.1 TadE-like protein [Gimesia algae]
MIVSRSGVVVLELILTAPALLIIMLAMVQISLIYVASEQTAYAARYAAKITSETSPANINSVNTGDLKASIDRVLRVGGLPQGSCRVILEHNVPGGVVPAVPPIPPVLSIAAGPEVTIADPDSPDPECNCEPPASPLPTVPGGIVVLVNQSVRTTVCVRLGNNIPDLLSSFGFSIQDYIVEHSTTYLYEVPLVAIP